MAKVKKERMEDDPFAEWRKIQLTPEQKAAARTEAEKLARRAAAAGAYERFAELRGKVRWDLDLDELREDRD